MPTYRITAPNGHTYDVTTPDGVSQDDVLKYVQQNSGNLKSAPPSAPAAAPKPDGGGSLDSFIRSAANGATFNLADTIAAAGDATIPLDAGSSTAPTWMGRFEENRMKQRARTQANNAEHPVVSFAGNLAGGTMNPVARALPAAQSLGGAALQGAGLGAGYGAGGAIQNGGDVTSEALKGAAVGGPLGALTYGIGNMLLKPRVKTDAAQALEAEGVKPTIGQSLGGTAQRLEDSYTSIPLFGDAIKDRQRDAISQFNRAAYNRVLEPLGLKFGEQDAVGNEGIGKVGDLISKAYTHAYEGATVNMTPEVRTGLDSVWEDAASVLPPDRVNMIQKNIDRLITAKVDENGNLSGDALRTAKNWFSEQARSSPAASMDERNLSQAYQQVLDTLKGGIAQNDPERGALLKAADTAFSRYVRIANAAGSNNASAHEGIFTPNQLGQAIRGAEGSTRRIQFAKGASPMQDLAQAGQQTLSQTVPDSGTAMRSIFEHPLSAAATAPAWMLGRAAYSKAGQEALKTLLFGAPATRSLLAPLPQKALPGLLSLIGSSAPVPQPF